MGAVHRVWVDCTAAAHPLVLRPIIERLEAAGIEVLVTTREYGQTVGILDRLGIPYTAVGEHGGAGKLGKARALGGRSRQLMGLVWKWRPELALAHGSVDLALVSGLLRIPSVQMQDYEYAGLQRKIAFRIARRVLVPDSIPVERMKAIGAPERKLFRFPGLKEEYYLADFAPTPAVIEELGLDREKLIVVVRPPPETSEYHAPNALSDAVLDRLAHEDGVQTVVIPRTEHQAEAARHLAAAVAGSPAEPGAAPAHSGPAPEPDPAPADGGPSPEPSLASADGGPSPEPSPASAHGGPSPEPSPASVKVGAGGLIVPDRAVDAQSLIAYADLVVSAGGTMNREAVALGAPVYTTFAGRMGGVDEQLIAEGRLRVLTDPAELDLTKRPDSTGANTPRDPSILVDAILTA